MEIHEDYEKLFAEKPDLRAKYDQLIAAFFPVIPDLKENCDPVRHLLFHVHIGLLAAIVDSKFAWSSDEDRQDFVKEEDYMKELKDAYKGFHFNPIVWSFRNKYDEWYQNRKNHLEKPPKHDSTFKNVKGILTKTLQKRRINFCRNCHRKQRADKSHLYEDYPSCCNKPHSERYKPTCVLKPGFVSMLAAAPQFREQYPFDDKEEEVEEEDFCDIWGLDE